MRENNTTKTNKMENKEANQIKLGKVDIYEPAENSSQNVSVELQIPYRFYLCGRRSLSEYERISLEDLRIKASTFFELVEFLSSLLREGDGSRTYVRGGVMNFVLIQNEVRPSNLCAWRCNKIPHWRLTPVRVEPMCVAV